MTPLDAAKLQIAPYLGLIKLIVVIAILGATFYGGYWLKSTMVDAAHARELAAEIKAKETLQKKYDELSLRVLEAVGKNDVIHTRTIEKQYREVEKPVYELCIIPESGILIQNQQRAELNQQIRGD